MKFIKIIVILIIVAVEVENVTAEPVIERTIHYKLLRQNLPKK